MILDGVALENIINYDETNLSDDPGKQKVYAKRGDKYDRRTMDSSKKSTSVMFAVTGDGQLLSLYVSTKRKTFIQNGFQVVQMKQNITHQLVAGSMLRHLKYVFFNCLALSEKKNKIICDNLACHLSVNALKECEQNNIPFVFLPPNSTWLCQLLELPYFVLQK